MSCQGSDVCDMMDWTLPRLLDSPEEMQSSFCRASWRLPTHDMHMVCIRAARSLAGGAGRCGVTCRIFCGAELFLHRVERFLSEFCTLNNDFAPHLSSTWQCSS